MEIGAALNELPLPGYKVSAEGASVEPARTPNSDQTAYALLPRGLLPLLAAMFRPHPLLHLPQQFLPASLRPGAPAPPH